jgi:hypothetical protein
MTIGIAAVANSDQGDGYIVTVSDRMLSTSDATIQGTDDTLKARKISKTWALMFSASDANLFLPIVDEVRARLEAIGKSHDLSAVQNTAAAVYREKFDEIFTSLYLSRFGFKNIADYRVNGLSQLGSDTFRSVFEKIETFDLGISFLGYGFDTKKSAHLFQLENPGIVTNHDLAGCAVIGSGFYMASASLSRKRMPYHLDAMIYRLLEAKFSAETAPGVGRRTTLFTMRCDGKDASLPQGLIGEIRKVWEKTLEQPDPKEATDSISNWSKVHT